MINLKKLGRVVSMILAVAMVVTSMPTNTFAEDVTESIVVQDVESIEQNVLPVDLEAQGSDIDTPLNDKGEIKDIEDVEDDNSSADSIESNNSENTIDNPREDATSEIVNSIDNEETIDSFEASKVTPENILDEEIEEQQVESADNEDGFDINNPIPMEIGKTYQVLKDKTYYYAVTLYQDDYSFDFIRTNASGDGFFFEASKFETKK